jgi:CubicO group peptidase (beta-lactamase class C family)
MKMRNKKTALLFLTGFIFTGSSVAYDFSILEQYVNESKKALDFPFGTSIAIVKDDEIIYQGSFGYVDIEKKQEVNADTLFYVASVTKPFFALTTLLKERDGDLNEHTPLNALFPNMKFSGIAPEKITVKHLLTHTTGVENEPLVWALACTGLHNDALRHKMVAATYPSTESTLDEFDYSNVGYNILGVWFDDHYQQGWQKTLDETVFKPLNMNRTSSYMSDAERNKWTVAKPYSFMSESNHSPVYLVKQDNIMQSAGGMISTSNDLARFLIAQLNDGKVDGKQIFPRSVIKKSHQVQAPVNQSFGDFKRDGYAWGWYKGEYMNQQMFHHFGAYDADFSHLSYMPEQKIGLVVLNNEMILGSRLTQDISRIAYSILLQQPEAEIKDKTQELMQSALERAAKIDKKMKDKAEEISSRKWQLSLNKSSYTGSYYHPLNGKIEVSLNDQNTFSLRQGNLRSLASADTTQDTMRVEFVPGYGESMKFFTESNAVTSLEFLGFVYSKI